VPGSVHSTEGEPHDLHPVDLRVELVLLPAMKAAAHEAHVQTERVADVHEGVGPLDVVRVDPLLHLGQEPLTRPVAGPDVLLEGSDCVLHDRQHQTLLRLEGRIEACPVVELRGQHHLGLELHTYPTR
jgi:hypothetical protein